MYRLNIEIEQAEAPGAIVDALNHAATLIKEGNTSGILTSEDVGYGMFELIGECPENVCDGSGEVADPEGGTKPCLCRDKKHQTELDGLDREEASSN